jgi:hypothetical protein
MDDEGDKILVGASDDHSKALKEMDRLNSDLLEKLKCGCPVDPSSPEEWSDEDFDKYDNWYMISNQSNYYIDKIDKIH